MTSFVFANQHNTVVVCYVSHTCLLLSLIFC